MLNIKEQTQDHKKGFTLIEALVAFSILTIALGAFISATVVSMKSFKQAENHYLASEIAKEGMELIISKKENHITCTRRSSCTDIEDWKDNLEDGSYEISSARPEEIMPDGKLEVYAGSYQRPICFIEENINESDPVHNIGKFGYCTGSDRDGEGKVIPGGFHREIRLESLGDGSDPENPDGFKVESIVKWGGEYEVVLETYLYGR